MDEGMLVWRKTREGRDEHRRGGVHGEKEGTLVYVTSVAQLSEYAKMIDDFWREEREKRKR